MSFEQRVTTAPGVLVRVIGDEAVLLNLQSELYLGLDPVGTRMWTVLHDSPSIEEGYEVLKEEYDVEPDVLRQDLEAFLAELLEQSLICVGARAGSMSGFVGIVNLDNKPIDDRLLGRMTGFMAFRGPDRQRTWHNGSVGFGHALAITTNESERECQPLTLDRQIWIVADARIDARADLLAQLAEKGEAAPGDTTDVELVLRAYRAWGRACVDHLLGDFAFAIWDAPRRELFCARDHLGVKSFFYAAGRPYPDRQQHARLRADASSGLRHAERPRRRRLPAVRAEPGSHDDGLRGCPSAPAGTHGGVVG